MKRLRRRSGGRAGERALPAACCWLVAAVRGLLLLGLAPGLGSGGGEGQQQPGGTPVAEGLLLCVAKRLGLPKLTYGRSQADRCRSHSERRVQEANIDVEHGFLHTPFQVCPVPVSLGKP